MFYLQNLKQLLNYLWWILLHQVPKETLPISDHQSSHSVCGLLAFVQWIYNFPQMQGSLPSLKWQKCNLRAVMDESMVLTLQQATGIWFYCWLCCFFFLWNDQKISVQTFHKYRFLKVRRYHTLCVRPGFPQWNCVLKEMENSDHGKSWSIWW